MKGQIALGLLALLALIGVTVAVTLGEQNRMTEFTRAYEARAIEAGATLFEDSCRPCHGPQGQGIEGVAPAINAADLFDGSRLAKIGYGGTLPDYVRGVIAAGRPVPSVGTTYPQRMPTWGAAFGGPLRDDQVDALTAFILNWQDRALGTGAPGANRSHGRGRHHGRVAGRGCGARQVTLRRRAWLRQLPRPDRRRA